MMDTPRRNLGELAQLSQRTEADERRILQQAQEMLTKVEGEMDGARTAALGAPADAERYQELVEERGRLQQVIAQAQQVLDPESE